MIHTARCISYVLKYGARIVKISKNENKVISVDVHRMRINYYVVCKFFFFSNIARCSTLEIISVT